MIPMYIVIFISFLFFLACSRYLVATIDSQEVKVEQQVGPKKRLFLSEGVLTRNNLDTWSLYARLEKGQEVQEVERFLANPQMFFPPYVLEELPEYLSMSLHEGNTLIHLAASKGYQRIVEQLCGLGVNLMHANYQGNTPLHCAALAGNHTVMQFLAQKTPLIYVKNSDGVSAWQLVERFEILREWV